MKIEKPDWNAILLKDGATKYCGTIEAVCLNKWFTTHVTPVNEALANGVEVYGDKCDDRNCWRFDQQPSNHDTHTALLINIQKIKTESAEDVLRDLIKDLDGKGVYTLERYYERAKKVLSSGGES